MLKRLKEIRDKDSQFLVVNYYMTGLELQDTEIADIIPEGRDKPGWKSSTYLLKPRLNPDQLLSLRIVDAPSAAEANDLLKRHMSFSKRPFLKRLRRKDHGPLFHVIFENPEAPLRKRRINSLCFTFGNMMITVSNVGEENTDLVDYKTDLGTLFLKNIGKRPATKTKVALKIGQTHLAVGERTPLSIVPFEDTRQPMWYLLVVDDEDHCRLYKEDHKVYLEATADHSKPINIRLYYFDRHLGRSETPEVVVEIV